MRRRWRTIVPHLGALALAAAATAVLVASAVLVPRVLETVADQRLTAALVAGQDAATVVLSADLDGFALGADTVDDIARTLENYPGSVDAPLAAALGEPSWVVTFPDLTAVTSEGTLVRLRLGAVPGSPSSRTVIEGTAPRPWVTGEPVEVAFEQAVAARVGAVVGSAYDGPDGRIVVSGIVADDDGGPSAQDVFHRAQSERGSGGLDLVTAGAYVDPGSIATLGPQLARAQVVATLPVRAVDLGAGDIAALERAANKTSAQGTTLSSGYPVTVSTRLPALLAGLVGEQNALVALAALLGAAPLTAAALVAALAVIAAERRRAPERVLASARGATTTRLALSAACVAAVAVLVGAAIGWGVAVAATPDAASAGFGTVAAVVVGGAAIAAAGARRAVVASRIPPVVRTAAGIVVLAAAAVAVSLLLVRGLPDTGVDPLLSAVVPLVGFSAGLVLARVFGWGLAPVARVLARGSRVGAGLAVARLARGSGRVLQITGVTIAVATATLALGLAHLTGDGLSAAAYRSVGADVRACGDGVATAELAGDAPDGVTALAEVRRLGGIPVTVDGRLRAVTVLSAPTAELNRVRAGVPVLAPSSPVSAIVSRSAAGLLAGSAVVGGIEVSGVTAVDDEVLPADTEAWVLLDDRDAASLAAPADTACVLITATDVGVVAARVRDAHPALDVIDTASETLRRESAPTVTTLLLLLAGAAVVAALAALAIAAVTEVAAGGERRRTRAVLRMIGAGRVRGLVAAEVVPLAAVSAGVGWGVGWAGVVVVAGAGGLADRLGITAPVEPSAWVATAGVALGIVALIAITSTVASAARGTGRRARRGEREGEHG